MSVEDADTPSCSRDTNDNNSRSHYTLRPVITHVLPQATAADARIKTTTPTSTPAATAVSKPLDARDPFVRPTNEDDDGYDPFSDRLPEPEPTFEEDPWR